MSECKKEEGMKFDILKAVAGDGATARLGRLVLPKRQAVETPNFFTITSRGVVPHLTPDTIARYCQFPGAYLAMEDSAAKIPAQDGKRLHAFTALPSSSITILGPRRTPAVKASIGNSDTFIQIFTSNGFQPLTNPSYIASITNLKPDIAIPLADMHYVAAAITSPQAKGVRRMCERTEDWMSELHKSLDLADLRASNTSIFAPTLPAPHSVQWEYLGRLSGDLLDKLSGLAVYDVDILPDLSSYPSLLPLPRLSLDVPLNPHEILRQVSLGIDIFLVPFLNAVSDAGVAMSFTFPPPPAAPQGETTTTTADGTDLLPLGIDLTEAEHATALAPLTEGCTCHACTTHHRAYLHHLLNAREMLAWTLLQLHNHHIMTQFFNGVRTSLAAGAEQFEEDCRAFGRAYEPSLPVGMGTRPRARGYHFKSGHAAERRNKVTWKLLQEGQTTKQGMEDVVAVLEEKLARDQMETPVVPGDEVDAAELVREGLGQVDIERRE
ncbi:tRNA-guanine transglycosylase [Cryphonectria parasitica EP155]|uniref:Queuine tRNA-ribosyltransferase accessory subunit 2 n=1 Tax=Cryphonectria parasitica (strain ATCC 38755 / EP155) TaxID=660469 RepID=A0A9P4YCK8_CRYP1|nr:tRNA-guanine transglycosylase [Cryphonectria parasitica EP155]KAF3771054.1 tRNA-guanine transglycosylase [Cryphonectria parasitica EP155]